MVVVCIHYMKLELMMIIVSKILTISSGVAGKYAARTLSYTWDGR